MRRGPGYIRYLGHFWRMQGVPEEVARTNRKTRGGWYCVSCDHRLGDADVWGSICGGRTHHKIFCCTTCIPEE